MNIENPMIIIQQPNDRKYRYTSSQVSDGKLSRTSMVSRKSLSREKSSELQLSKAHLGFNFKYPTRVQSSDKPAFSRVEMQSPALVRAANPSMLRMKQMEKAMRADQSQAAQLFQQYIDSVNDSLAEQIRLKINRERPIA